jgi:hypothetical protein
MMILMETSMYRGRGMMSGMSKLTPLWMSSSSHNRSYGKAKSSLMEFYMALALAAHCPIHPDHYLRNLTCPP